jgi:6-phosphogluconolactonase (cycloisomerase 2 family)
MKTNSHRVSVALFLSMLAACGGSGGGGNSTTPTVAPSNLSYSDTDVLELAHVELAALVPTYQGDVDSFEIAPSLPAGVVLDPVTGVVVGAAEAPDPLTTYTITARNAGGFTTAVVRIEIAAPQRFAFATNSSDDSTASLSIDTEAARFLRGPVAFPGVSDTGAELPIAHPNGRFVYVPHSGTNTLVAWRIDESNGALDRIVARPLDLGPHSAAFHPTGAWLCVTNQMSDTLRVFSVDPTTGVPTQALVFPLGTQPTDVGFSPDGRQLFVANAGVVLNGLGSSLVSYAFDAITGSLAAQGPPLALNGARPSALTVDPHAPLVYLALNMFDAVVAVRTSATGALIPAPPLRPAGDNPVDVEIDAAGRTLFAASATDDEVRSFRVTPSTGLLTLASTVPAGTEPRSLQRDPTAKRVFAVARASGELLTYTVDTAGALELESSMAVRPGTNGIACATGDAPLAWTPRFVHVANSGSDDVHSFRVDAATGALTFTAQAFTDDAPSAMAIDPRTRVAVVVAGGAHTIQSFTVAPTDGALAPIASSLPITGTPTHVAIDAAGRFAYVTVRDVAVPDDGRILTFRIDSTTGALTQVDSRAAGLRSLAVAIEPTGQYIYVANAGDDTPDSASIAAFLLDPTTGIPTAVGTPVVATGIVGLAFHPEGRTAYAVLRGADSLGQYLIDRASGSLSSVPQSAGAGLQPAALVLDPRGRFAWASYTGNAAAGEVAAFPVLDSGELGEAQQTVVDGREPMSMSLDPSGRFLFAANRGSHDISVLAVDRASGFLTVNAPQLAGTAPTAIVASGTTH